METVLLQTVRRLHGKMHCIRKKEKLTNKKSLSISDAYYEFNV
jgi:hypothetical protein